MFRSKKRLLAVAAAAATLAIGLAGCSSGDGGGGSPSGGSPDHIKIGFIGSLTGPLASSGINSLVGLKAGAEYLEDANKGLTVEVVERDTAGEATAAVAQTRELAQAGVTAIYYTTEAFPAVQEVLNQVKIPGGTAGGIGPILDKTGDSKEYKYAFSTGAGTSGPTSIVPTFDYLKQFGDKIGMLDDSSAYNKSQVELAEKIAKSDYPDLQLVSKSFPTNASDASAQLAEIRDAKVDSMVLWSYGAPAVTAMSSLAKLGWNPEMGAELGLGAPATVELIPSGMKAKIAAGPIAKTFVDASAQNDITKEFVKRYLAATKKTDFTALDTVGAISFDWAVIVAQAVKESGSTNGDEIKNYLTAGNELKGANGTYKFGPDERIGIGADQLTLFNPAEPCTTEGLCVEMKPE
nr:ABC transporter substrate-binding protein [Microbacterium bovistercoris]